MKPMKHGCILCGHKAEKIADHCWHKLLIHHTEATTPWNECHQHQTAHVEGDITMLTNVGNHNAPALLLLFSTVLSHE